MEEEAIDEVTKLYEILIPTAKKDGTPIISHKPWEEKVRKLTGIGWKSESNSNSNWVSRNNDDTFGDVMIAVRVLATLSQMERVTYMTSKHYDIEAVMFYVISNEIQIKRFKCNCN